MSLSSEKQIVPKARSNLSVIGHSQFLTSPVPAQPISFKLSLDDDTDQEETVATALQDSDSRLMEMLAAQAAHREDTSSNGDEDSIAVNKGIPESERKSLLQKALHIAASNGDVARVQRILRGPAKEYVDLNAPDEEGTAPIIYASCFVSR